MNFANRYGGMNRQKKCADNYLSPHNLYFKMEINELFRPKAGYYIYILHVFFKSHMIVLSLVIP